MRRTSHSLWSPMTSQLSAITDKLNYNSVTTVLWMEREVDDTDDAHLLNSVGADEAAGAGTTLPRTARRDGVTFYQLFWLTKL